MCDGPIPPSEKSYRLWRVIVCDLVNSAIRRPWPALGGCAREVGGGGSYIRTYALELNTLHFTYTVYLYFLWFSEYY